MADQVAVVAGGCFWCTEAVFLDIVGVKRVESGYTGGTTVNPSYKQVCAGDTGHAEAIRVTFDPAQIAYADLLDIFFATHDPTQLNRQGNDVGTQYRSAIFPQDEAQEAEARAAIARAQEGLDVFAYFNNDTGGHAPRDAVRLRGKISAIRGHREPARSHA